MPDGKRIIISPSDGKIIRIEKLHDEEIGESFVVSIFLNIYLTYMQIGCLSMGIFLM